MALWEPPTVDSGAVGVRTARETTNRTDTTDLRRSHGPSLARDARSCGAGTMIGGQYGRR